MEHAPLLPATRKHAGDALDEKAEITDASPVRWWLLFVLSALAFEQGWMWNDWGPISDAAEQLFGWGNGTIALLANWGPIFFLVAFIPSSWIMDTKGLRWACLFGSGLCFVAALLRSFPTSSNVATGLIHVAQILNGIAGPIACATGPLLSSVWFPPHQRTTSTSILTTANYFGVALAFVLGPHIVSSNGSNQEIQQQILHYMWIHLGVATFVFGATLLYFPSRPPSAPSRSATAVRHSYFSGLKQLLRNRQFWILAVSYGSITGVFSAWSSYLEPNLKAFLPPSSASNESGWIGFYATVVGSFGAIGFSILADRFQGQMKRILLVLCCLSGVFFAWFSLVCQHILPHTTSMLYASSICGGFFINSTIALFYELGVETTYPIAEGVTTCTITTTNNIAGILFLILPEIPNLGSIWANWTLVGSCIFSFLLLIFFNENYCRLAVDLADGKTKAINEPEA